MGTWPERLESKLNGLHKRPATWAYVVALTLVVGAIVAVVFWRSLADEYSLTNQELAHRIWWRAQVYARKATGGVPDLTWGDLWQMTRQRGGFGLESLALGVSVNGSVSSPYNTDEDLDAGVTLFGRKCAVCHGDGGTGWSGPALNHAGLKHGDSELAIYKVLRDGIAGTPMVSADLSGTERWQVVGYVRSLMAHGAYHGSGELSHRKIYVTSEEISAAGSKADQWLTYSGSLDGRRYTPLNQITSANVSQLRIRWAQQFNTSYATIEATPLVVDGTIYVTKPPGNVVAIDARSGNVLWRYERTVSENLALCCGHVNRGLAILGESLFLGSVDGYLVAINANSGKMIWETKVADSTKNYSMTGAPLVVGQSVVVGVAGGDYGVRGFLAAYDAANGKLRWKFDTIPGPGQQGHDTWQGSAWENGGGATWVTGSYDPSLDLLYWGVGNPAPDYNADVRPGDNLFSNSVIAIHGDSGKLAWHFQFTPHDEHDWDSNQTPVLTDLSINGTRRKVICWANRNGFYYILDRTNGQFLLGAPFVEQNWAKGLDENGRPILRDGASFSNAGTLTKPGSAGGTNWQNPAFDQSRGLIFIHATEGSAVFTKSLEPPKKDVERQLFLSSAALTSEPSTLLVRALDVVTGAKIWEHPSPPLRGDLPYSYSGLLATGGGLVFGASGGSAFAVESATGREVWRAPLGGDTRAAPISFTVDGRQVIALSVGRSMFLFGLP